MLFTFYHLLCMHKITLRNFKVLENIMKLSNFLKIIAIFLKYIWCRWYQRRFRLKFWFRVPVFEVSVSTGSGFRQQYRYRPILVLTLFRYSPYFPRLQPFFALCAMLRASRSRLAIMRSRPNSSARCTVCLLKGMRT